MKGDIPRARELLKAVKESAPPDLLPQLEEIESLLVRAPPFRRKVFGASRQVTPSVAEDICAAVDERPDLPLHQIAEMFGVNQGTVSDAVRDRRRN